MIGWTRDELYGFYRLAPDIAGADREAAIELLRRSYGGHATKLYEHYEKVRPDATPGERAAAISADHVFLARILRFADDRAALDAGTYVYRFDWRASDFGACHCIDLPFTFANLDSWGADAAMLGEGPRSSLGDLAARYGHAIGSFVRTGQPEVAPGEPWPRYQAGDRAVARFDDPPVSPERDLGQPERELFDACGL
jgi:para-nitrobenzyl esterase